MDLGSEAPRLGSIETLYVATILYQVSSQEAIADARLQLYNVAIKSFSFHGTFASLMLRETQSSC